MTTPITSHNIQQLLAQGKPLVIDFGAAWCAPCKRIAPIIDQLAAKYADAAIVGKADVEEQEELAQAYGVRNVPTVLFVKDGQVVDKQVGAAPLATYEQKLEAIL